jgi:hypothetical protein
VGAVPALHDLACVVHVHSVHSDGTGTVAQIADAARRARVDAVLLTDHDSLEARRRGDERWHGPVLMCVGTEVSPQGENHYLAFGLDEEVDHEGMSSREICAAVTQAGGFGFLAHPFSRGSPRFRRAAGGIPWRDLDCDGYAGIEVWSFVTDTAERIGSLREAARFVAVPQRVVDHPPRRNLAEWDRLAARRPVVGIGGIDAHQIGVRIAGHVPLRLMAYRRSFSFLRTHALLDGPLSGEADGDRDRLYAALRAGRCYLAMDRLAPAGGFRFDGDGVRMGEETEARPVELRARLPRPADVRLLRDGEVVARACGTELGERVEEPGVYRVEARLTAHGRARTWILSNPIYLR